MKKQIMGKAIAAFAGALFCLNLYAQTEQENLKKYWNYRDKLQKHFVRIGTGESKSICFSNIDDTPVNSEGGWSNTATPTNQVYGYKRSGDAMTLHGDYIAVLASQYKLLKDQGKDVTAVLNELYYAIETINRLDRIAEPYFYPFSPLNSNGFFIRDDISKNISNDWNGQYVITENNKDRYNGIRSDCYRDEHPFGANYGNEMSQDQIFGLLQGFVFIKKMVGHVYVKPSAVDVGFYLDDEVKSITQRIMNYLTSIHIHTDHNELFEFNTVYLNLIYAGLIVAPVPHTIPPMGPIIIFPPSTQSVQTTCTVTENWVLTNPVTGQLTGTFDPNHINISEIRPFCFPTSVAAEIITGNDYASFYNSSSHLYRKTQDILLDGDYCLPYEIDVSMVDVGHAFWESLQEVTDILSPNTLGTNKPYFCISTSTSVFDIASAYLGGSEEKQICFKSYNTFMALQLAAITGTWDHNKVAQISENWHMEIFDLMYAVLNNTTPIHPQSYWENILNSAPCQGPYNNRRFDSNGLPIYDSDPGGWFENTRWAGAVLPSPYTFGEYNGNDYMLLYNLYQLAYKNTAALPEYEDISCPCEQSKEYSHKINNNITSSPSGSTTLSAPVTVGRKFSDYLNFDVKIKEYLIYSLDVINNLNLNVETDLVVCNNSTLKPHSNGTIIVGNAASVPSSIIVRAGSTLRVGNNGLLKVFDKSKVIIEKGATLYIENGSEIQLLGDNAVLDIQGDVYIEPATEFTFTYPGTNSGYVRFSQPGYVAAPYTQVTGGAGSKIVFNGQSETDKVLEIDQDILYVSINNGISEFNIEKGNIHFTGSKEVHYLSTDVSTSFRRCLFDGLKGHLAVWGQPNCEIRNCKFDAINIIGNLFALGTPLQIIGTEVTNTTIGVDIHGKGVKFLNLNSHDNHIGLKAELMKTNSLITNCKFNNNHEQGAIINSSPIELQFISSKINQNNEWGLEVRGPSVAKLKCSQVKENEFYGFYMGKHSALSMNVLQNGGYVDAKDNGLTTIYLDDAHSVDLNNGYNELRPSTIATASDYSSVQCTNYANCPTTSIEGTLKQPVGIPVFAEQNKWQPNNSLSLQSGTTDKFTRVISTFTPSASLPNIHFVATSQSDRASCGFYDAYCPGCTHDILKQCTDCNTIETEDFTNTKTNSATEEALAKMDSSFVDGYKQAVDLLHQVIKYPLPIMTAGDKTINAIAERQIVVALAQAIEEGQIEVSAETLAPEAMKVLDVENMNIEKAIASGIYAHVRDAITEKALIYYMLEHRDQAYAILDSITPFLEDEADKQEVTHTKCLIDKEIKLLSNQISQVEYLMTKDECATPRRRRMNGFTTLYQDSQTQENMTTETITVYPNPASNKLFVEYAIPETNDASFVIYDVTGKELFRTKLKGGIHKTEINDLQLNSGMYFYKVLDGKSTIKQDKLTIIK